MPDIVLDGFNRKRTRRPPRKPDPPDVVDTVGHYHKCERHDRHGHVCQRRFGPYYSRRLLTDAIRVHLLAQHVNSLAGMDEPDKADARMARMDTTSDGYER